MLPQCCVLVVQVVSNLPKDKLPIAFEGIASKGQCGRKTRGSLELQEPLHVKFDSYIDLAIS